MDLRIDAGLHTLSIASTVVMHAERSVDDLSHLNG